MNDIEQDQLFHDLESRYSLLLKDYDLINIERDNLQGKVSNLTVTVNTLSEKLLISENKLIEKDLIINRFEHTIKEIESSNSITIEKLVKKTEEAERLTNEIKLNAEELILLQNKINDSQLLLSDYQKQLLPMKYDIDRLTQDNKYLEERLKLIDNDLNEKKDLLSNEKRKYNELKYNLELQVLDLTSESNSRLDKIKALQDQINLLSEKNENYYKRINQLESDYNTQSNDYMKEIDNLNHINSLYKRNFDDAVNTISELENQIILLKENENNLKIILTNEYTNTIKQLEEKLNNERQVYIEKLAEYENQLQNHKEVKKVDSLVDSSLSNLSVTELYNRIVQLENDLNNEVNSKKELEIYLNHILKDIESKTPLINSQKRDYQRLIQSYEQMQIQMNKLIHDNKILTNNLLDKEKLISELDNNYKLLDVHNKDICLQLQHLLKLSIDNNNGNKNVIPIEASNQSVNNNDIISEYLVSYDNITDIQIKNIQLLKTIRKLEITIDSYEKNSLTNNKNQELLENAFKEINFMKENRKQMEDMLNGLIQQRDMYKAMVKDADNNLSIQRVPIGDITPIKIDNSFNNESVNHLVNDNKKLNDRLIKYEEIEKILNETINTLKIENSNFRVENNKYLNELNFYKERNNELDQSIKSIEMNNQIYIEKYRNIEKNLLDLQLTINNKNDLIHTLNENIKKHLDTIHYNEITIEVHKSTENRYKEQINHLNEELKRQSLLSESIYRIELGLNNKIENEKNLLQNEKNNYLNEIKELKQQLASNQDNYNNQILQLQNENNNLINQLNNKNNLVITLEKDLTIELNKNKIINERYSLLEKQHQVLNDKFIHLKGKQILSSIDTNQIVNDVPANDDSTNELTITLDKLTNENNYLKQQLVNNEKHLDNYKQISLTNENKIKELIERIDITSNKYQQELLLLQNEKELLVNELNNNKNNNSLLLNDYEKLSNDFNNTKNELTNQINSITNELTSSNSTVNILTNNINILKQDIIKYQNIAKESYSNYEHELQVHAKVEKELLLLQNQLIDKENTINKQENDITNLLNDFIIKEKTLNEEVNNKNQLINELTNDNKELRNVNNLLHTQIQELSKQVDSIITNPTTNASTHSTTELGNDITNDISEVATLKQSITEMREIIKYMKRDKDMLQAKLSLSESEISRHLNTLIATNRVLDETKAELNQLINKQSANTNVSKYTVDEIKQMENELVQLKILHESNTHLRSENELLLQRINKSENELVNLRTSTQPLIDNIRKLESERDGLQLTIQSNEKEISYWRERLHSLVSRYNEIDPEEYRLLEIKYNDASNQLIALQLESNTLKSNYENQINELNNLLTEKEKLLQDTATSKSNEITRLQNTYNSLEKNNEVLRNKTRDFKNKLEETMKSLNNKNKIENELKSQINDLNEQINVLNNKLTISQNEAVNKVVSDVITSNVIASDDPVVIDINDNTTKTVSVSAKSNVSSAVTSSVITSTTNSSTLVSRKRPASSLSTDASTINPPVSETNEQSVSNIISTSSPITITTTSTSATTDTVVSQAGVPTSTVTTNPTTSTATIITSATTVEGNSEKSLKEALLRKKMQKTGVVAPLVKTVTESISDDAQTIGANKVVVSTNNTENIDNEQPFSKKSKIDSDVIDEAILSTSDTNNLIEKSNNNEINTPMETLESEKVAISKPVVEPLFTSNPLIVPSVTSNIFSPLSKTNVNSTSSNSSTGGIFGSAFNSNSSGPFSTGVSFSSFGSKISSKPIEHETIPSDSLEEGQLGEEDVNENDMITEQTDEIEPIQSSFTVPSFNLPSNVSNSNVTIPLFGSGKASIPMPSLKFTSSPLTQQIKPFQSSFQTSSNIFNNTIPLFGTPITSSVNTTEVIESSNTLIEEKVDSNEENQNDELKDQSIKNFTEETTNAESDKKITKITPTGAKSILKKVVKPVSQVTLQEKKESRLARFAAAAAAGGVLGTESSDPISQSQKPVVPTIGLAGRLGVKAKQLRTIPPLAVQKAKNPLTTTQTTSNSDGSNNSTTNPSSNTNNDVDSEK